MEAWHVSPIIQALVAVVVVRGRYSSFYYIATDGQLSGSKGKL